MTSHLYCNSCWGNTGFPWLKITEVFPSGGKQFVKKLCILLCFTGLTPMQWTESRTIFWLFRTSMHALNKKTDRFLLATQPLHSAPFSIPIKTASGLWHALRKQSFSSTLSSLSQALPGWEKPGELLRPGTQTLLLANHLGTLPAPLPSARAKMITAQSTVDSAHQVACKMGSAGCWLLVKHKFSSSFSDIKMKNEKKTPNTFFSRTTFLCKWGIPQGSPTINM